MVQSNFFNKNATTILRGEEGGEDLMENSKPELVY